MAVGSSGMGSARRVPVVVLTGHLGAGKTTLLNHLLSQPGARVGVVINDFGAINVDAALVTGHVDEPASIAGGCVCCLPDAGGLDGALEKLTHPRLELDVVIIEASGLAEPGTLARLVRFSGVERVRPSGVIEVVDAVEYFHTLDDGLGQPPVRFGAATLVVVTKADRLDPDTREEMLDRIERRVRERNPRVPLVVAPHGRIDPSLVYDAAGDEVQEQLTIDALLREAEPAERGHRHAASVTVGVPGPIEPAGLVALLDEPPASAYRIKGVVTVGTNGRQYVVNVVGGSAHVVPWGSGSAAPASELVAIGLDLDSAGVEQRLRAALVPAARPSTEGLRRLRRRVRLSL